MPNRRRRALLMLLPVLLVAVTPVAAQESTGGGAIVGGAVSSTTGPTTPAVTTPATTPLATTPLATTPAPAPAVEGSGSATPTPPPYLTAGIGAQQLPAVATVGSLSEPVIPLSPTRIAAIAFAVACLLLLGWAGLMRALGLRTAAQSPAQATRPPGRLGRLGDRARLLADDVRDFLARSR